MAAAEKLVDSDFLGKLVMGSMESAVALVDEAVLANAELFGGESAAVSTVATYSDHMIVANEHGDFFRARWAMGENGVVISEVEEIDVPVYETKMMGAQVRDEAREAVSALLNGDQEAAGDKIRSLYQLVKSGVRLTAEGVEDQYQRQTFADDDWFKAVREQDSQIRAFLGAEALRIVPSKTRFPGIADDSVTESQAEAQRGSVTGALTRRAEEFIGMRNRIALAKQIREDRQLRDGEGSGMAVADFVQFVAGLSEALDSVIGILGDAQAVADDGCLKCLARIHDGIAEQMYEWSLASAFCEKLARRFVVG